MNRAANCCGLGDRELSVVSCRDGVVNVAVWAERSGVAQEMACRWFHVGVLPVLAQKAGRLIVVDEPTAETGDRRLTAVCAGVLSGSEDGSGPSGRAGDRGGRQPDDPGRQGRRQGRAGAERAPRQVPGLLCGPQGAASWPGIGTGSAGSARGTSEPRSPPQGRELVAAGAGEAGDDLVRDVTAVLTSMCACRYGRRASAARAGRPLAAAAAAGREAA